jgi:hypothetical protein
MEKQDYCVWMLLQKVEVSYYLRLSPESEKLEQRWVSALFADGLEY